ncbi:MAG: hypothetical protein BMS9Abin05_1654 [Rhodothermia bacterium]|nr:MAG: hypothetical protein BMS9Abin05_1654 [Rhodothermia bacterium]
MKVTGATLCLWFTALIGTGTSNAQFSENLRPVSGGERLSINQAVALASQNNRELNTLREGLGIGRAQLIRAQTIPNNPEVGASYAYVNPIEQRGIASEFSLSVSQEVEIGGQRGYRTEIARSKIEEDEARFGRARQTVVGAVSETFYRVLLQQEKLELAKEVSDLTDDLVRRTLEKFEAGYAPEFEINFARLELQKALREETKVRYQLQLVKYSLNYLMGRPFETEFVAEGDFVFRTLEVDLEGLKTYAANNRGDLKALQFEQRTAAGQVSLARSFRIPNPRISLNYRKDFDNYAFSPTISLPIRLFNRNKGEINTALATQRTVEAEYDFLGLLIETEVASAYNDVLLASKEVQFIEEGMLQLAEDNLNLVRQAYLQGEEVEIIEVITAQRSFVETQTAYLEALYSFKAAVVILETVVGREIRQ